MANEQRFRKQSKNGAKIKKTASSAAMCCVMSKKSCVFKILRNERKIRKLHRKIIKRSLSPIDRSSIHRELLEDFELVKFQLIDDSTIEMEEKRRKVNCLTG